MTVKESFLLKGKLAIVTGGAGRLGPKFAEALAEAGSRVILSDLDELSGRKAALTLSRRLKGKVLFKQADVTDENSVRDLAAYAEKKFGRIDILVNAAMGLGKNFYGAVETYPWKDWNKIMEINAGGAFLLSRQAASVMKKNRGGSIINIGSIYGVVAPDQKIYGKSGINSPAVYAASKGAVIQLTRYLAAYWAPFGIRVNAISPGGVFDDQEKGFVEKYSARAPMGRMLDRNELKGAVVFLASAASSYVTGHNLMVDGGWTAW